MATKLQNYNQTLRTLGDLRLATLTDDVEARYVLDDAWPRVVEQCFHLGLWNFATKTELLTALGSDNALATYTQSTTTITVTKSSHGLAAGNSVYLTIGSGGAATGWYVVASVPTANTYTVISEDSASRSGSLTMTIKIPGYNYAYRKPVGWARTVAISSTSLFSNEVKYRDEGGMIYTNVAPIYMRYISKTMMNDTYVTIWPEIFARVVAAHLALEINERMTQSSGKGQELEKRALQILAEAKTIDAMDQPVRHLRNSRWLASMRQGSTEAAMPAQIDVQSVGDVG